MPLCVVKSATREMQSIANADDSLIIAALAPKQYFVRGRPSTEPGMRDKTIDSRPRMCMMALMSVRFANSTFRP